MDLLTDLAYLEDLGDEVYKIFDYCLQEFGKQKSLSKTGPDLDLFKKLQSMAHKQFVDTASRLSKKYPSREEEQIHRDSVLVFWGYYYCHRVFSKMIKE